MLEDLATIGLGKTKILNLVLLNRVRADVQLSITQVQDALPGSQVITVIPPAPELAFQSAQRFQPLITIQPDGLIAQQFRRLVEIMQPRSERQ
jgi:pilus assembly protein CpaE